MKNPAVSVVIPVYNSEKTVGKCLDSLINQTYSNIEIICVNDCSKDNSLKVLQSYKEQDERIVIINHIENKNAGGARNTGIRAAKGEYICFVDNDDWMRENALDILVNKAQESAADIVVLDRITYFTETNQIVIKSLPEDLSRANIIRYACAHGFGMLGNLYKKSLFVSNNIAYPEKLFFEDNAIAIPLVCWAKSIAYVSEPLYYYACAPSSVTSTVSIKKIEDRMVTTNLYLANVKNTPEFNVQTADYFNFFYLRLLCQTSRMATSLPFSVGVDIAKKIMMDMEKVLPNKLVDSLEGDYKNYVKSPVLGVAYYHYRRKLALLVRGIFTRKK